MTDDRQAKILAKQDKIVILNNVQQDYQRIEQALAWLADHFLEQPRLDQVAAQVGLSEFHFQRLFTRWVGISPKKFLQYLTLEQAKQSLANARSVLDATFDAGLSSPGRLHDLFVSLEAITPGEYKTRGAGLTIHYGFHHTPFGDSVLLHTQRGICGFAFINHDRQSALHNISQGWENATFVEDHDTSAALVQRIFQQTQSTQQQPLKLLLRGTAFQIKVWEALLRIPASGLASYEDIANAIANPAAVRAVGQAIGRNRIAYLIPCHRVIRKSGMIGAYRWGQGRKLAMIGWEAYQADQPVSRMQIIYRDMANPVK